MKFQRPRGKSALTLVELLVVIATIAILAALLLPALSRSMQRARQIQCVNNVRQLGQAMLQFVSDYRAYPFDENITFTKNGKQYSFESWDETLNRELDGVNNPTASGYLQKGVWKCP